jgi:hypothetical protein
MKAIFSWFLILIVAVAAAADMPKAQAASLTEITFYVQ